MAVNTTTIGPDSAAAAPQIVLKGISARVVHDSGRGRALVALVEQGSYGWLSEMFTQGHFEGLHNGRLLLIEVSSITNESWSESVEAVESLLVECKVRQLIPIAAGATTVIGLHLALQQAKSVRQLVLIDAQSRPPAPRWDRVVGALERALPMGLPFRGADRGFDAGSYLQRIRCPLLLVSSTGSAQQQREHEYFQARVPTLWMHNLGEAPLVDAMKAFLAKPAKCSQKNR